MINSHLDVESGNVSESMDTCIPYVQYVYPLVNYIDFDQKIFDTHIGPYRARIVSVAISDT